LPWRDTGRGLPVPAIVTAAGVTRYSGVQADAQAQRYRLLLVEAGVLREVFAQLLGQVECAGQIRVVEQGGELFAAEACQQIAAAQALLNALGRMTQAGIARQVAVAIIDLLEVIQIQPGAAGIVRAAYAIGPHVRGGPA